MDVTTSKSFITTQQAADLIGLSAAWFERKRWLKSGPPYLKIGRTVRYEHEALVNWFQQHKRGGVQ